MKNDELLGSPPWGYAAGRSADGEPYPYSPPTPLLVNVTPLQYAALEQPTQYWLERGLLTQVPLRVAETIADPALVPHLVDRARSDEHEVRRLALFTIGWTARHFGHVCSGAPTPSGAENGWPEGRPDVATSVRVAQGAARSLVELAVAERDPILGMTALDALPYLPEVVRLVGSPLPGLMRSKHGLVRHPALRAAHLCPVEEVEHVLLESATHPGPHTRAVAVRQLRRCVSPQVDDALVALLLDSDTEVRGTALASLVDHDPGRAMPHVREAAASWPSVARYSATWLLTEHGDEQDVALVAERVKRLLGRARAVETIPSELTHLLPFLARYREQPAAGKALAYVSRRWTTLFDNEQRWVAHTLPDLVPEGMPTPPPPRPPTVRAPRCPTDLDAIMLTRPTT
ncbi:HEAT repeat domain-containing protein [Jannaschia sp. R86511]|uniref:HEAT repeat domain-containing protein n=1 Tax=Jannaschia sp. R86511 TaxID=3093853 RepID=UPI0036D2DA4E